MEPVSGKLVDHFFRHEYGRLVALLTRLFGLRHLDMVEDMVQASLLQALQSWRKHGIPKEPAGWIYRVARNKVIDALRKADTAQRLGASVAAARWQYETSLPPLDVVFLDSQIADSQLRMIFACGHPILPVESRIALTLKTLCGFSVSEIARGLLLPVETVKKRITRAKQKLVEEEVALEVPPAEDLPSRLDTVHAVLYLMFNEGYSTTTSEQAIRHDLCEEAARLCHLLCQHPHCSTGTTYALLALMLFHAARLEARLDRNGLVLLLEEQDRSRWDYGLIRQGVEYLTRSMGGSISHYHLEAGIAMYHCKAASFADTNWQAILSQYDRLVQIQRSPVYLLNRAIALAYVHGPDAGIQAISEIADHPQLKGYHLLPVTLGELYRRAGDHEKARAYFEQAWHMTESASDRQLIERRLKLCR